MKLYEYKCKLPGYHWTTGIMARSPSAAKYMFYNQSTHWEDEPYYPIYANCIRVQKVKT